MGIQRRENPPIHAPPHEVRRVEADLRSLFPTWIYSSEHGPRHLNHELERLAHELMQDERNGTQRTNDGGWHYAFDLFELDRPPVADLHEQMHRHVQAFLDHFPSEKAEEKDELQLRGWINVNRQGDSNVLHCHPGAFVSGVYYVRVPEGMRDGEILFRDPRGPAVAMYETPGIDLPWVGSGVGIPFTPSTGQVLLFPSWLLHSVNRFQGPGERISVSFNASNP